MKTKNKLEDIIKKKSWYYVNDNLTTKNFPIPETIQTENWKIITMPKSSFISQEALDEIKSQGCRPANVYELATFDREQIPKGKYLLALGQLWQDPDGYHRVPSVFAGSDGDFRFVLGDFVSDWGSDDVLLCFCDNPLALGNSEKSSNSLTLESAIQIVKEAGYQVSKII